MKVATLLLLVGASADLVLGTGSFSTKTVLNVCKTKLGPTAKKPVPTTSRYLTIPLVAKRWITSTPSTTVTPAPITDTVTGVVTATQTTTALQITDTVTDTFVSTITAVEETTTIITSSVISTVVSTAISTTTIPAPAGFTPVQSTIPNSMKRRKSSQFEKKDPVAERARGTKDWVRGGSKRYPVNVYCGGIVAVITTKTSTVTAKKTSTITAPTPTFTNSVTSTATATITDFLADAVVTNTVTSVTEVTSTSTVSVFTTVTSTTTIVAEVPGPTIYAACSTNNIVSTSNGRKITNGNVGPGATFSSASAPTAYDCCVACITSLACGASIFYSQGCLLSTYENGRTCSQNDVAFNGVFDPQFDFDPLFVSNGNCGKAIVP
ncbi:hypothetical protein J4E90_002303 [Alternaria incomplexa]|uniref:uncharacterized protein n=1 Tax=Alternaria incomplexa TaxID=1187928 RepID=UPI00221F0227|nr:uncharacterized protein J4E90_002303 [Alternaria incomplexa]KAI4920163.1 hypothetical protein J4E90_002303 [Alternaria incomplexa]